MTAKTKLTFADIEAQTAGDIPVEFEPFDKNGDPSGVILLILSDQSPTVQRGIIALTNAERQREQVNAAKARGARPGEVFTKVEDDRDHTLKLTALRIAGWKGDLDEPYSPENAVRLLKLIPGWVSQVLNRSAELGGFTATSSKA
jgi:hypothetical protein